MSRSKRRKLMRELARKHCTILRTGIPVASALLVAMPAAYAQQAPATAGTGAAAGGLEEVVVTAQKRVENLQDVPISVQVLDTAKLEQLNIVNIDDYVKFAPGIAYVRGEGQGGNGEPGESHIYIRGIASGGTNHSGSQPSVGEYLDEQPVTTIDGNVDIHIYDIQRIEVLEGPQGTLYGASSQSGTVRIITNKPDPTKFSAGVDVQGNHILTHGSGYEIEGFVNIPITSNMAVRLVGWDEHDGGYISNVAGTNANACIFNGVAAYLKNDYNPVNTKGGRGALRWNLGDWTITPTFMAQNVTTEGFFAYDPGVGDLQLAHFSPENSSDSWYQSALTVEGKMSNFDLVYSGGFFKRDTHSLADYSDYSSFYDRVYGSGIYWTGNSGNPIMPQELVNSRHDYEKWSHELRLSTPVQLPVKGTFGVFIQRQLHNILEQYIMPGYGFVNPYGSPLNPAGLADAYSIPTLFQTIWLTDETRVDRDQAAFAEATWDMTRQLSLTGGIRAYKYDNTLDGFFGYSSGYSPSGSGMSKCFGPAVVKFTPCTDLAKRIADHGTVPRVNLTYKLMPEAMVYATYSKGFRPGGVNRTAAAGIPPYSADFLKNYEVGWKTQLFDRRLRWNGALFREDWTNFQYSFLGLNSVTIIENGASARVTGLESSIEWAPTRKFLGSLNFQWINPYLTQPLCSHGPPCPGTHSDGVFSYVWAPEGTHLPITPDFKGSLVARFNLNPIGKWEPYIQGNWTYQSSASVQLRVDQSAVVGAMPPYALVDLRMGATADKLTGELYITNLFDRLAQLSRFTQTVPTLSDTSPRPVDTQPYIIPAQPRTIGLKVAMRF
ncbi:MAG: TonB-dependent receptor [Gammaproteobacteria bacterium]|nr:MAG: TonB-dependent receptor [Gammaproteobacteria bacterium]